MNELTQTGFEIHGTSLEIVGKPTFEQWESYGKGLRKINKYIQFWVGDWLNYGEDVFGEEYAQVLDEMDYSTGSLGNMAYVSRKVDPSRRHETISYSHHQEVASLEPEMQKELLTKAEEEDLSVRELRAKVKVIVGGEVISHRKVCPNCGFEI